VLLSEDLNTGEFMAGVRMVNPFANLAAVQA
jgi:predicted nucleic acid-binding protein